MSMLLADVNADVSSREAQAIWLVDSAGADSMLAANPAGMPGLGGGS
jgi:hypothetical protein